MILDHRSARVSKVGSLLMWLCSKRPRFGQSLQGSKVGPQSFLCKALLVPLQFQAGHNEQVARSLSLAARAIMFPPLNKANAEIKEA